MAANRFRRLDTTLSWIAEPIRQQRSLGTERGMPARSQNRLKTKLFPANSLGKRDLADNDELFPKAPARHEPREPKGPGTRLCVIPLRPRGPMIAYMNARACENGHGYTADKRTSMSCYGTKTL